MNYAAERGKMTIYMLTMPWSAATKRIFKLYIERNDIHDWTIGFEVGRDGYRHVHIRLNARSSFEDLQNFFTGAHIEEASTDDDWYERKDGHFVCSKDTMDVRKCRFGRLRNNQARILQLLGRQGDRGILVWADFKGSVGKSFFCRWLVERGRAYYVPPTVNEVKQIIQYVCAGYKGQPYIVIDIPRSARWSQSLYTGIESIKDGLVYDTRYTAKIRDIWGVKILVLTNTLPNIDALSKDRWTIANAHGVDCTIIASKIAKILQKQEEEKKETTTKKKSKTRRSSP